MFGWLDETLDWPEVGEACNAGKGPLQLLVLNLHFRLGGFVDRAYLLILLLQQFLPFMLGDNFSVTVVGA